MKDRAPSAEQLDQLLAPIALYPDSLRAQITTASTNPQEILDVDNWLSNNPGLSGEQLDDAAQQQGFDPAFLALVQFPSVLQMMAENIDDYAAIGQEVTTDQAGVSASIQRLRAQAYSSGALRTTRNRRLRCNRVLSRSTLFSLQIPKLCTCLNTTQPSCMPLRVREQL